MTQTNRRPTPEEIIAWSQQQDQMPSAGDPGGQIMPAPARVADSHKRLTVQRAQQILAEKQAAFNAANPGTDPGATPMGETPTLAPSFDLQKANQEAQTQAQNEVSGVTPADATQVASAAATPTALAPESAPPAGMPGSDQAGPAYQPYSLRNALEMQATQGDINANLQQRSLLNDIQLRQHGIETDAQGAKDKIDAQAEADVMKLPYEEQRVRAAEAYEKNVKNIYAAGQKDVDAQMIRVKNSIDQANAAEVKDFWHSRDTGARIMGVVSQMLAGAANGLAGRPGEATPLDRIIERDMQAQEFNANQKNKAAYREQGMLGLMQRQIGDKVAAQLAFRNAAWDRVKAITENIQSQYGGEIATAAKKQIDGVAEQRKADNNEKAHTILLNAAIETRQSALRGLTELDRTDMMANQMAGQAAKGVYQIPGVAGAVNQAQFEKLAPDAKAYSQFMELAQRASFLINKGMSSTSGMDYDEYSKVRSSMLAVLRQMQHTGAALSPEELANVEKLLPNLTKSMIPFYNNLVDGNNQMVRAMDTMNTTWFSAVRGVGVRNQLDPNDPYFGNYVKRYMNSKADMMGAPQ